MMTIKRLENFEKVRERERERDIIGCLEVDSKV